MDDQPKPTLFIASSSEQRELLSEIEAHLAADATISPWTEIFALTQSYLSSLLRAINTVDFALFVFAPDDVLKLRDKEFSAVRDNVIFELGLFLGHLGPERCAIIAPREDNAASLKMHMPSDLAGIKMAEYDASKDLRSALKHPCDEIRRMIRNRQLLSGRILGKWIEIKERPPNPFAIVNFQRGEEGALRVTGVSYNSDGKPHVTFPHTLDFSAMTRAGVLHGYDALLHEGQTVSTAQGISVFNFDLAANKPPVSGSGYYVAYASGQGFSTGRVHFKLKRLTDEFDRFLVGSRKFASEADRESALIRALTRLYSTRRIVLTGGPCSGKSTLIAHLKEQLHHTVEESAQHIMTLRIKELGDPDRFAAWRAGNVPAFQAQIFAEQLRQEDRIPDACPLVFLDRCGIDGIAYLQRSGNQVPPEMQIYAEEMRFSAVFMLETLSPEHFRGRAETGRTSTWAESVEMGNSLNDVYTSLGHRPIWVGASRSPEERLKFILDQVLTQGEAATLI